MCNLSSDKYADMMYLDFSKAFDQVDQIRVLLKKLESFGIQGKLYNRMTSFLKVPQGTVLGPLLFLIYINDIFGVVKHSKIKVFADDSKLHKDISSHIDRLLLQEALLSVLGPYQLGRYQQHGTKSKKVPAPPPW